MSTPTFKDKIVTLIGGFAENLTAPNDNAPDGEVTTVWNQPRDMKIDVAVILITAFDQFDLDIPVVKNGAFEQTMLWNPETKKTRPVVAVVRTSDVAKRMALGELDAVYQQNDPRFEGKNADGTPLISDDERSIILKNQHSTVSVDITLSDLNQQRADYLYLLIKTIMFAAELTFQNLGYLNPPMRTGGTDSQSILDLDGGGHFLFERTLTYQGEHLDFIGGVEMLAKLIAVTSDTMPELDPNNEATLTVNLGPDS